MSFINTVECVSVPVVIDMDTETEEEEFMVYVAGVTQRVFSNDIDFLNINVPENASIFIAPSDGKIILLVH